MCFTVDLYIFAILCLITELGPANVTLFGPMSHPFGISARNLFKKTKGNLREQYVKVCYVCFNCIG